MHNLYFTNIITYLTAPVKKVLYLVKYLCVRGDNLKPIYEFEYLQLGLKIAYYRKLRGLTQEELAEKIDRNSAFIGHVEAPNISKAISSDTLFDIASVLDVPPYKFLMFDDD